MNYRHAYHAGNFADCVKHALFVALLRAMARKDKPFLILDTHAGIGRYDVSAGPAARTGEWRNGIEKVLAARPEALSDYVALIDQLGLYPGSPAIAAALLRASDRLVACELHPEDAKALRTAFAGVPNVAIHERDGYTALRAFLPPPERRGLILIDPPYERPDEFPVLANALETAHEKFSTGVFAAWYPIKHRAPARSFFETLKLTRMKDVIAASFWLREPLDPARLNGCGLVIVNPPFRFAEAALPMLEAFVDVLGEPSAGCAVERLIDE
jgi:23S rRNA (adenine2030-N6)-methyltransferase